jgi:hypothetical protein
LGATTTTPTLGPLAAKALHRTQCTFRLKCLAPATQTSSSQCRYSSCCMVLRDTASTPTLAHMRRRVCLSARQATSTHPTCCRPHPSLLWGCPLVWHCGAELWGGTPLFPRTLSISMSQRQKTPRHPLLLHSPSSVISCCDCSRVSGTSIGTCCRGADASNQLPILPPFSRCCWDESCVPACSKN